MAFGPDGRLYAAWVDTGDGNEEERIKEQQACPEARWDCGYAAGSGAQASW